MGAAEVRDEAPRATAPGRGRPGKQTGEGDSPRKGERTRLRILAAARRKFAELGYERATIRAIAAEAEVDKSSVIQYFGTKDGLFREAVRWDIPVAELTADDPAETVENLVRGMLGAWAADPDSPMAVLVRASMTSEEAAELLRGHITAQAVDPVAAMVDSPDARLRAALCGAMMMGVASQRYLLRMPDLAAADTEDVLRLVVPVLRGLIDPEKAEPQG
ncbi:TetR/AcrR family transcriptional regulator [Streptomyces sp. NRRL F-525]|uniref:TetR/AcrR family transcriptional regulator n=1 Tax=Streptomyces sp. NRRL F-525 TaxID=1463861 RepID=UPI000A84BA1E|nr:TetR family transcriptional regulator [Streptomyces sp. NRRL F-525]